MQRNKMLLTTEFLNFNKILRISIFLIFILLFDVCVPQQQQHFQLHKKSIEQQLDQKYSINLDTQIRYDAPDDCHYHILNMDDVSLTCNLRTVNSEFDTTNFSVIPSEHTIKLRIICSDDIMAKSSLESRSFIHLARLKDLSIEYCKLSKFTKEILYGLNDLRNLTIRTNNINLPSLNLDIELDSFQLTKNLDRLDISQNNIWSLPDNIFCVLSGLTFLNISENRLQDVNELGFRDKPKDDNIIIKTNNNNSILEISPTSSSLSSSTTTTTSTKSSSSTSTIVLQPPCTLDLEILDVSYNHFVLLPANSFGILKRLKHLKLNNNEISMVGDKALIGLKSLQILNLSSNKIVALPSELFLDQTVTIQEIYLQNNSISVLSPKLFSNLEQLQALDLSYNQITSTWIDRNTFIGLIRLVLLNLSHNKITKLDSEIFTDLYTLQILNLRYNQIDNIQSDTFSPMNNLHTLLLSHNKLKYLDAYSLNGLYVLSLLSLDNNQLIGIHPDAFRNCSSLQDLNLNGNQLKMIPLALRNMRLLRTIDLGENQIEIIDEKNFYGLTNLYGLRLIGNHLKNITKSAFIDLPNLQILNLAKNLIDYIEIDTFDMTKSIQAIRLDGNELIDIKDLFKTMPNLLWLNISDNKLEKFDYSEIPNGLQWLDLHKNFIDDLTNANLLDQQLHLQTLDASFNRLTRITPTTIPNSIELLFLNDNLIQIIEPHTFMHKENLTRVDLYANQIQTLDIKSLRILSIAADKRLLPEFYIGGNPFVCDCNIDWLQKINLITSRQYPRIMDLETIYCKLLNNRERTYISLIDAEPKHFLCTYKTHCFALCHCCEFDACDCEMTCPTNCTCFHDQSWSTNLVECSNSGYIEMPTNIPMDTTELYIDGNDFNELSGHSFIGRKNLFILFANNSNIQYIYNTTFSGLRRLMILHLEDNRIFRLNGMEFNTLENLRELYLHNNRIQYISNGTFLAMRKLEVLRLDGNKLIQFEIWQLQLNPYLVEIGLSNNIWSCECSYLSRFRNYLQTNQEKIIDANHIACVYNNLTSILKEKNGTKCTLRDGLSTFVRTTDIENLLPLLLAATCAFIGFFGLILGIFCYRNELNLWAHQNFLMQFCLKSPTFIEHYDKDRPYDAYITYSLQDEHFINQILVNTLENDIGYRLCLHYRDFNVNAYIADTIIEAVESSKQAILILSKNFLYNEWTRFEYKSAIHEILKRRRKLIFILYGDLPQRDIDNDMRHYLRTNTCIEWDDKKFWQKLRIALPNLRKNQCLTKRSAINIYATAHDYSTSNGNNGGNGSAIVGNVGTVRSDCTKRYDCNNYATINDCNVRNYTNSFDTISCKYNNSIAGTTALTNQNTTLKSTNDIKHKNDLSIKSLERKHHEYAVPSNCLIGSTSNYSIGGANGGGVSSLYDRQNTGDNNCECCPTGGRFIENGNTTGCSGSSDCNRSLSNCNIGGGGDINVGGTGSIGSGSINGNFSIINTTNGLNGGITPSNNSIFNNYSKNCNCNSSKYNNDDICLCHNRYDSNISLNDVNSIDKRLPHALWA